MLNKFRIFQNVLLKKIDTSKKRYFYNELNNNEKLLAILGAKGVGKTTALLQYLIESDLRAD